MESEREREREREREIDRDRDRDREVVFTTLSVYHLASSHVTIKV